MKSLILSVCMAFALIHIAAEACLFNEEVYERKITGEVNIFERGVAYENCKIKSGMVVRDARGVFSIDELLADCGSKLQIEYWSLPMWLANGKVNEAYEGFTGTYDDRHINMIYGFYDGNNPFEQVIELVWAPNCKSMRIKDDHDSLNFPIRRFKIEGEVGLVPLSQ